MATPTGGRNTVEFLINRNRLEQIAGKAASESAFLLLDRATRRLLTAAGGLEVGDAEGAFSAAYDAYRMAAEALLICQGLRATGGDGSHMTVEDAISAQYSTSIVAFAKPTFERFRRTRHTVQYFDPSAAEITEDDALWALATARGAVEGVNYVLRNDPPGLYQPG